MTNTRPRWESEIMRGRPSNPQYCKTCMFSHGESPWADKPEKGSCQIYEYPEIKPDKVYFGGTACDYYEKD